jgi:methionyl aminopeptidase
MIILRSPEEIELLRQSSQLVSKVLGMLAKEIKPGISTARLDKMAEDFIRSHNAVPGFLGYNDYPKTLCTSLNDQVVHGIPSEYQLKDGDIISIDCGVILNGFYGDCAYTFAVGTIDDKVRQLLRITKESLFSGISEAKAGNRIGDIGFAVQSYCEQNGYSVVREMVGHGLGKRLHEAPEVPNYGKRGSGPKLQKGMVICIEPMINMGKRHIVQEKDGWTVRAQDRLPSAHFEHAVAVDDGKAEVLSTFSFIEEALGDREF